MAAKLKISTLWLFSLAIVFLRLAPITTLTVIFMTLVSQVSMILSFILPIKVVMLLSSKRIPSMFTETFAGFEIDRDAFIIFLAFLTVAVYGLNSLAIKARKYASNIGAKKLLQNQHSIPLFENQDEFASTTYSKYTEAISSIIFSSLALCFLFIYYVDLAILIVSFIALILFSVITLSLFKELPSVSKKTKNQTRTFADVCFMFVFLYIVYDFLYLSPPSFLIALVSVILSRLMLFRLALFSNIFMSLTKHSHKINLLFFQGQTSSRLRNTKQHKNTFWSLIDSASYKDWLYDVIGDDLSAPKELIVTWVQSKLKNVAMLEVVDQKSNRSYLIKLFNKQINIKALHEASLLTEPVSRLPAPPLLNTTLVNGYHCHVFDVTEYHFQETHIQPKDIQSLRSRLLEVEVPDLLEDTYSLSKKFLWERIDSSFFERLKLIATENELDTINHIQNNYSHIKRVLKNLPLTISIPIKKHLVMLNSDRNAVTPHWADWSIEPSGYGWNIDSLDATANTLIKAGKKRSEFLNISHNDFALCALMAKAEDFFLREEYTSTISVLKTIKDYL